MDSQEQKLTGDVSQIDQPLEPSTSKSKKPFVILLIVILLVGLSLGIYFINKPVNNGTTNQTAVSSYPSKQTSPLSSTTSYVQLNLKPINEGDIALLEDKKIYLLDTATMQKREIPLPKGNSPSQFSFSRDGNTLFTDAGSPTNTEDFLIYNMITKKAVALSNMEPNPRVSSSNDVSPNNQYFVLTQSCCPGDAGKTIIAINGKIIKKLVGGATVWSPDSSTLAMSKGDIVLSLPLGPQPANSSVYLETINNNVVNQKALIRATYQESYIPVQWKDDHTLLLERTRFDKPFPQTIDTQNQQTSEYWLKIFENPTENYVTIDTTTLQTKPATYTKEQPPSNTSFSPDKKWQVFTEGNSLYGPTYIAKSNGSDKMKISDNAFAVWRPVTNK